MDVLEPSVLIGTPFDQVPLRLKARSFGVDYVVLDQGDGRLYVTRYGWPWAERLLPDRWHSQQRYVRQGCRLEGGTGAVYKLPTRGDDGRGLDLVIKFSRFGQDVPFYRDPRFPQDLPAQVLENIRYNSPFEEFGVLMDLRRSRRDAVPVLTKRPLAIYCPSEEYELWQFGRTDWQFQPYERAHREDQSRLQGLSPVELNSRKEYVLLYGWVKGMDAQACLEQGLIGEEELQAVILHAIEKLAGHGFRMLDIKPRHLILRRRRDGGLLRRKGRPVYALIDFELLEKRDQQG